MTVSGRMLTEHSVSLCKSYKTKAPKLQERLLQQSLHGTGAHPARARACTMSTHATRSSRPVPPARSSGPILAAL